jgi:hypothetical protein
VRESEMGDRLKSLLCCAFVTTVWHSAFFTIWQNITAPFFPFKLRGHLFERRYANPTSYDHF